MISNRSIKIVLIATKFLGQATDQQLNEYYTWCEKNPDKSPINCPVIDEMPFNKIYPQQIKTIHRN